MLSQTFLKIFPPPKFLNIPYAGLDISDDEVRCLEYSETSRGLTIHRYGARPLATGVIVGGEIRNPEALSQAVSSLTKELNVHVVKASLPEEKMYLFRTEVPSLSAKEIRQNIEFKLEENVPLSPEESIFFFKTIPHAVVKMSEVGKDGSSLVCVSVAPRSLVMTYLNIIKSCGVTVLSFEIQAKAIARALVPYGSLETQIIVHIMNYKTGIYVICGEAVCFTSTIAWGNKSMADFKGEKDNIKKFGELKKQIEQVENYWSEHGFGTKIQRIIFSGQGALTTEGLVSSCASGMTIPVEVANVWLNAFSNDSYIPPITREESLDYAVAAGLALPT